MSLLFAYVHGHCPQPLVPMGGQWPGISRALFAIKAGLRRWCSEHPFPRESLSQASSTGLPLLELCPLLPVPAPRLPAQTAVPRRPPWENLSLSLQRGGKRL